jgi:O-antigen/teichoic acid export membrane protein
MPATQKDIGRFFRHSAVYALGNVLNRVGAFVLLPIYTNYLTVSQYGEIELFYAIASVVSGLLSIGIAHATLRFYFEYVNETERHAVVSTNLLASFAISLVGVLPLAFNNDAFGRYFFGDPVMGQGILLVLASLMLELSSQISLAYLRAKEYSTFFISISLGKLVVQFAANTILLVWFDAGVLGVLTGNLAAVALGWLVLTVFTISRCGLRFEMTKLVPVLKYSFPFLLSTMVALVSTNLDRFLINSFLTLQALGLYALALKFSKLLTDLIGEPFNLAYGSFRFTIMGQANAAAIQARVFRYLFSASSLVALGLVYFTGDVLRVMSAPEYWQAAELVPLLAIAGVLKVISYPLQSGILYQKHTRHIFHIGAAVAVVSAVCAIGLIMWFGIIGACVAVLVAAVTEVVLTNRIAQRYFKVDYEYPRLLRLFVITLAFYLASLPTVLLGVWAAFALKTVLLMFCALALIKAGALEDEEIDQARHFLANRWRNVRKPA